MRGDGHKVRVARIGYLGSPPRAWGRRLAHPPVVVVDGSPPRAWGRPNRTGPSSSGVRFTPTCVGTALLVLLVRVVLSVHPHVRGDGHKVRVARIGYLGSPPRAWGRRLAHPPVVVVDGSPPRAWGRPNRTGPSSSGVRFTPTCVGTALLVLLVRVVLSVHPHVRGDGAVVYGYLAVHYGSPPRAWGRHRRRRRAERGRRFTPTCVGTAQQAVRPGRRVPVHPHVRGDGDNPVALDLAGYGSPPRAWGRLNIWTVWPSTPRFTPTCVGTALQDGARQGAPAVHPHVRGDGWQSESEGPSGYGSPPRAWGRRRRLNDSKLLLRFTPTCVGTAFGEMEVWALEAVHPHVRGDGRRNSGCTTRKCGSPPRAWGRRPRRGRARRCSRFSRVPGSGVRGRGSGERETTASSLAGKEESSRKEDNSGQGKDGPAGAIAQGGNGR